LYNIKEINYDHNLLPEDYEDCLPKYYFNYNNELKEEDGLCEILDSIQMKDKILEMGVGTGQVTKHLITRCKEFNGIDISKEMTIY